MKGGFSFGYDFTEIWVALNVIRESLNIIIIQNLSKICLLPDELIISFLSDEYFSLFSSCRGVPGAHVDEGGGRADAERAKQELCIFC